MKFKFPLETVLRHREMLAEKAKAEHAVAHGRLTDSLKALEDLYRQVEGARADMVQTLHRSEGCAVGSLVPVEEFIDGLKVKIQMARQELREVMQEEEAKRESLIQAATEHQVMVKLKERQYESFRQELKKRDLKEMDDLVITRYRRNNGKRLRKVF